MAYVVCEPCHDCKYTDCVAVCPVECFYQDDMMLYIDPVDCIDCEGCIPECPVDAIFIGPSDIYGEGFVPPRWHHFIRINAERSAALKDAGEGHITKIDPQEGPGCRKKGPAP